MDNREPTVHNPSGGIFSGCAVQILGGILFLAIMGSSPGGAIFCGFAGVIIGGLIVMNAQKTHSEECDASDKYRHNKYEMQVNHVQSIFKPKYITLCKSIEKPSNTQQVYCNRECGEAGFSVNTLECWINSGTLCFLTSNDGFERVLKMNSDSITESTNIDSLIYQKTIQLTNIKFFQREGDVYTETKINGGGGGGSSLKGALVGGVLAGDAGAVIGSRKAVAPITSETITHDDRRVILYYYEDSQQTTLSQLNFDNDAYNSFMVLMPDKEYHAVIAKESTARNSTSSPTDQIRELAKLKEEKIITEEEFVEKKRELLSKI